MKFRPRYAGRDQAHLIEMISEVLRESIGKRRFEIDAKIKEIEGYGDYTVVRGFYNAMLELCKFEREPGPEPGHLRDFAFSRMSEIGTYDVETANLVINEGARKFGISPDDFKRAMWSDLPQNEVLVEFREREASEVISRYNFQAVSSLLLKATSIRFWVSDRWKEVLWAVKRLGLMYQLDDSSVTVSGPATLIHNSRAYGYNISRLFSYITGAKSWWIEADVGKRVLVASSDDPISSGQGEITFDSEVERKFYQGFQLLKTGWNIVREPEPLRAGTYAFIPDFLFEKGGIKVYMEIVGFWTDDYLERKFRKLREVEVENLIIAIDSSNYRGELPEFGENVFTYKGSPDPYLVHKILMKLEKPLRDKLLKRAASLKFDAEITTVEKIASDNGLPEDVVREAIIRARPDGYIFDGDNLISSKMAQRLRNKILELKIHDANQAISLLSKDNINASISTLISLGLEIKWHGLQAEIKF